MKCKHDFVTNSSSTSFILGQTQEGEMKIVVEMEVDISKYIRDKIINIQQLDKWRDEECRLGDDKEYLLMKEIIERGGKVFILHVSDDDYDDAIEVMLCQYGLSTVNLPDNFVVINGSGGY